MDNLTARESEVLAQIAQGHANKIIAHKLGMAEGTVKVHVKHALRKLGVHSRTQAALAFHAQRTA